MKANVLQLIDSFNQGGTERQAVQLARLLHESGRYRVHLACLKREGVLLEEALRLGLGEIPEFRLSNFYDGNMVRQLRRFARLLKEREIDVLHTHDFYTNIFGMAGASLARRPAARIASRRETGGMRSRAQRLLQRRAFGRAKAIVANSEAVRRELVREGVREEKLVTIYNGLDVERLRPKMGTRAEMLAGLGLEAAAGRRLVTIVANMRHEVKDQRTFLKAAGRVRAEHPDACFVLAGEGELLEALRSYAAELGLAENAFFIGRTGRVAELLSVSEVCVLSSTNEGFANSILEYMAAARPVVVTDVGGAREAVQESLTGYIVAPGDFETMAARISSLLCDEVSARAMGERGRRRVEEKFSCAAQLARTEELYDRLLAGARAGQSVPEEQVAEGREARMSEH